MKNKTKGIIIKNIIAENHKKNSFIKAKAIKGRGRGKALGFPTLNLKTETKQNFKPGVYLAKIKFNHNLLRALLHFGPIPSFNEKEDSLEVYILGFNKKITIGQGVEFKPLYFLRPIKKFKTRKELSSQIKKDVAKAKSIFKLVEAEVEVK
ncbi:hypothetical protein COT75_04385 [Candidatus Beckwithbacteria bacterium CG10_big_fil_rev_8_21_14_0_10_34_10]|uniref:riboflavin kinase n=1 Tax=Candidatus Beckwithbacteria bacterium CG10_big_fil_rev_8_21_14_0_10_34_10 TaxID=1974495 RepID=A0A2H0W8B8_9BACT|nr:MAG: hypothetical protein COT75_04385 [Candidatus Beckwithbacteria bacterium CG10_big_fil_rev_8_21_14_0_10_34_10]